MSSTSPTKPWSPLATSTIDDATSIAAIEPNASVFLGIETGTATLTVREVRGDGHLGPPLPIATAGAGGIMIVPANRVGRRHQINCSDDLTATVLSPSGDAPDRTTLEPAVRGLLENPRAAREWSDATDVRETWSELFADLERRLLRRADDTVEQAQRSFRDRIDRLESVDDAMLGDAMRSMVRPGEVGSAGYRVASPDSWIRATSRVLERLDVAMPEKIAIDHTGSLDPVEQICRQLHIQYRGVKLSDRWWRDESGPLLASRIDDDAPIALIPSGSGYTAVIFESDGTETEVPTVDQGFAKTLELTATMFYRPLPSRKIGLRDLFAYLVRGNVRDAGTIVFATLVTSILTAAVPILTGMVVGTIIPTFDRVELVFVGAVLIGLGVGKAITHVVTGMAFLRIETRASMSLTAAFVDRVLQLPAAFFRKTSAGDLTQRVMAIEQIRSLLTQAFLSMVVSLLAGLSNLGVLVWYDAELGLVALGIIAIELILILGISIYMARLDYRMAVAKGQLDGFGIDVLTGIRQIWVQNAAPRVLAQILARLGRVAGLTYRVGLAGISIRMIGLIFSQVALVIVFIQFTAALESTGTGPLESGGFVAFVTALTAFLGTVLSIAPGIQTLAKIYPQYLRLRPILEAEPESTEHAGEAIELAGRIAVDEVVFRYDPEQPPILDGVSIEARPGEFVAIVGRTGCGKSTLLRVMLGLEKPESGTVRYEDVPLDNLDASVVRSQVGVVMQSNDGLSGNVRTTILGAGSQRTMDDAWTASAKVGMSDEIENMPMGMLTMVTPTSMPQSQLQRLMIARALVNEPEVLFLDEATSALDNQTQAEITETIERLGTTRVVIAHRLSTIRRADRIYVLDQGRVVQQGDFETLAAQGGHFRDIMAGQLS